MSKIGKLLSKMRNNPHDWQIDTLKSIAELFGVAWRQPGTSHVTFRNLNGSKLSIPAHKPIKPVYIKEFLNLLDEHNGE